MNKLGLSIVAIFIGIFSDAQTIVPYLKSNGNYILVDSARMNPICSREFSLDLCSADYTFINEGKYIFLSDVNQKGYLYDISGKEYIFNYDQIKKANTGAGEVLILKSGLWGVANPDKVIVPPTYEQLEYLGSNYFAAQKSKKWGVIDNAGKLIIDFKYTDFMTDRGSQVSFFGSDDKYWIFHESGKALTSLSLTFDQIRVMDYDKLDLRYNLIPVSKDEWYGFLDVNGKEKLPFIYSSAKVFNSGFSLVDFDGKKGYIDTLGNLKYSFKGYDLEPFNEGYALIMGDNNFVINNKGEKILQIISDSEEGAQSVEIPNVKSLKLKGYYVNRISTMHNGLFKAEVNTIGNNDNSEMKKHFIFFDVEGKIIIELKNMSKYRDSVGDYVNGFAKISIWNNSLKNYECFYIDKSGRKFKE